MLTAPLKHAKLVYNLRFFVYTAIVEMPVRLQNRTCSDYRKGAVMRKPASCVLSIALSLVMTVGFIPSPALAEIASAPEPAAQSAGKPNESPAETTSGQARANDQISAASGTNVTANATQPIDASMFSIEDTDIRYTGNPVMPTVTSSTVPSDQYTVAYENNVAIGQATAVVTADDQNYSGTCAIPFEIKPANAAANYQHSTTAQSGDITLTVQWNDPRLGQETTFHVTATGGSGAYQFRMDAPTYMDPDGSSESVADPSRNQWQQYTGECTSHDYQFEMAASGTYYLRFYLMDKAAGVYYLRSNVFASANDDAYPAVSAIVKSAVDKCSADTDGSDYARALWLHDWTLDHLEYDHDLNWCSAESGLTRHQGTCESYQRIYSKLLDAAGIANGRITGNGHTWNAVKIDGKWCQMDLTWDDTSDNWYGDLDQRHLYFGLTDELMAIAHSDHTANYQKDDYAYRSTDLSNNYFVRNGKAGEWAEKYADRIQQHLDAKEESFSIDADNQSFPPSISGIQNGIVAYAMNLREWSMAEGSVTLTGTSNVTAVSSYQWSARFDFKVDYPPSSPTSSIRLGGNTRYDTMVAIADAGFTSSDTVVLASGENFPDALSASSLAGAYKAPVIMTSRDSLSEQAKTEIERLGASKVFIIGSPAAISTSVESMLGDMGLTTERIAGSNRQETAAKVAAKTADAKSPSTVIVASGENFPDALSISPYAYAKGYPIYLTEDRGALSLSTIKAIQSLGTVERVIIVGSSAVVSESSESQLESIAPTVERWSGSNRYETSLRIAEGAVADGMTWSNVVVASGENFPDGLAGASLAGKRGGVLLLTAQGDASAVAHAIASAKGKVKSCYVLGSEAAVSANAKKQIDSAFS